MSERNKLKHLVKQEKTHNKPLFTGEGVKEGIRDLHCQIGPVQ